MVYVSAVRTRCFLFLPSCCSSRAEWPSACSVRTSLHSSASRVLSSSALTVCGPTAPSAHLVLSSSGSLVAALFSEILFLKCAMPL